MSAEDAGEGSDSASERLAAPQTSQSCPGSASSALWAGSLDPQASTTFLESALQVRELDCVDPGIRLERLGRGRDLRAPGDRAGDPRMRPRAATPSCSFSPSATLLGEIHVILAT